MHCRVAVVAVASAALYYSFAATATVAFPTTSEHLHCCWVASRWEWRGEGADIVVAVLQVMIGKKRR